jgi:peptidoglycan/xylan/chitin deacetylase (PgdA/CDA1 family)
MVFVKTIAQSAYVNRVVSQLHSSRLTALCYHGVIPDDLPSGHPQRANNVSVAAFKEQLEFVCRWFHPVSVRAVRDWCVQGTPLPKRPLLVTFDDGYRNNLTCAAPLLKKFGVPAVIFISTGYIDTERLFWHDELVRRLSVWPLPEIPMPGSSAARPWPSNVKEGSALARDIVNTCKRIGNDDRLRYLNCIREQTTHWKLDSAESEVVGPMTWKEVRKLVKQGFAIGSHTIEHPTLSRLTPAVLEQELRGSKARIEREASQPCFSIAYPNGTLTDISPDVLAQTEAAGYDMGFTMAEQLHRPGGNRYRIARISVPGHAPLGALRIRASGLHTLLTGHDREEDFEAERI